MHIVDLSCSLLYGASMRQTAFVIETHGKLATVVSQRATSCGSCAGKASCSTLGSWKEGSGKGRILELTVQNDVHAKLDDEVVIEVEDGLLLKTAFRLYGIPMLMFIFSGMIVWYGSVWYGLNAADAWASVAGILAVLAYYAYVWKQGENKDFSAKIVAIKQPSILSSHGDL